MMNDPVLQLLQQARESAMPADEVVVQLSKALRRNLAYLARRERRGTHTAYDDALEDDCAAMARAIVLLQKGDADGR